MVSSSRGSDARRHWQHWRSTFEVVVVAANWSCLAARLGSKLSHHRPHPKPGTFFFSLIFLDLLAGKYYAFHIEHRLGLLG